MIKKKSINSSSKRDQELIGHYSQASQRILVTGSSGFIGRHFVDLLKLAGHQVYRLVRRPSQEPDEIFWNPLNGNIPRDALEGLDAIVHLAGKNIAGRWSKSFKEELFVSRCRDTWLLSHFLTRLKHPPKCLISASAIGIYGDQGEEPITEESPLGTGFLADLCKNWERAAEVVEQKAIRLVHPRFATVLSPQGGMLAKVLPLYNLGLGAIWGKGSQFFPWIALEDAVHALYHVLMTQRLKGAVNFSSPNPLRQKEFSLKVASALHRPCFLRLPAPILKLSLGEMAEEMLLPSVKALPQKLLQTGFQFQFPLLELFLDQTLDVV